MVTKIHHVGIVVERLDRAYGFWRDTLGLPLVRQAEIPDQGVRAALLAAGGREIELLGAPTPAPARPAVPGLACPSQAARHRLPRAPRCREELPASLRAARGRHQRRRAL